MKHSENMNQLESSTKWMGIPVTSPVLVLLASLVLIVVTTIGAKNLYFRGDYNIFFDDDNQQVRVFNDIQDRFAKTDSITVVVSPESKNVFTPQMLELIRNLTEDAWQTPYSSRVDSITNYQHTEAEEDDLWVADLVSEDFDFSTEQIEKAKKISTNEPVTRRSMVSEQGDVAVINITVQFPEENKTAEVEEVYNYVSTLLSQYKQDHPQVDFYKTGIVSLNYAFMLSAQEDIITLVPIMLLVILLFLSAMLRSFSGVLSTLIVISGSVLVTMGVCGWMGLSLNAATVNIPTLVMTLAVADSVHVIATVRHYMSRGSKKVDAVFASLKSNSIPIFITSVTTATGFLMMNMSESPALRDFGTLSALGVMVACLLSLTMLPALLCILPFSVKNTVQADKVQFMDAFGDFVVNNRNSILALSVLFILAAASFVPLNKINDDSVKYFDKSSEFRQGVDFMQERISGMGTISVVIDSNESQGIVAEEFLSTLNSFTHWLREQDNVDHVLSLSDVFKRLSKNMHGDDQAYYQLPENRELAAQYLLMYEMSLPYGLDLNNQLSIDKSALKVQITTENLGSHELIILENNIYDWFDDNAVAKGLNYTVTASSPTLMFAHIGATNMKSMLTSLPLSLVLISGLLMLALRSIKLGAFSILPNMIPAVIGFGFWGLISGEINLGLSVVASLTLGIVVDDTVHFLSKYQIARKEGKSPEDAVRFAFHTVGRALWITTVVLVAGFAVLAMSGFKLNSDMGLLSGIIIGLALVVDFLFLPCVLMLFDKSTTVQKDPTLS